MILILVCMSFMTPFFHFENVPVVHEESDLFRAVIFADGSLGASLSKSGGHVNET